MEKRIVMTLPPYWFRMGDRGASLVRLHNLREIRNTGDTKLLLWWDGDESAEYTFSSEGIRDVARNRLEGQLMVLEVFAAREDDE